MSDGRRSFACKELRKIIKLVREMPNADERLEYLGVKFGLLDGGSVHRFNLIKEIENRIKKLKGVEK